MALADVVQIPASRTVSCSDLRDSNSGSGSQSEEGEGGCSTYLMKTSRSDLELSQGRDSGIECGSDAILPDEETSQKIMQTVEFYFSDANILKDQFLLKHVRRNKEGYVSLKLVSSFRKVRNLCRNWKAVAESIKKSKVLALNSEGTKVRRLAPLPPATALPSSKTVLVYGLSEEKQMTIESLSDMFSKCGEIALIRILKSNSSMSTEIKKIISKNPEIQSKGCGVIEFEELDGVVQALALDTGKENGLRIIPVDDTVNKQEGKAVIADGEAGTNKQSPKKKKKSRRSLHGSKTNLVDNEKRRSSSGSIGYGSSGSNGYLSSSPTVETWFSRRHSYHPSGSNQEPASATSSFSSLKNRGYHKSSKDRMTKGSNGKVNEADSSTMSSGGSQSPWRMRRELMSNSPVNCLTSMVPVLRIPRGPDGSNGFQSRKTLPPTAE